MSRSAARGLLILTAICAGLYIHPSAVVAVRTAEPAAPDPLRQLVDTAWIPLTGAAITVRAGEDLQAVLDAAQPGDVIALQPGAVFRGPFVLRNKRGDAWITIRSAAPFGSLPPPGTRIDPSYAPLMPKLEAEHGAVLQAAPGAHHYRFVGIEIRPTAETFLYNLVVLGTDHRSLDDVPHHIVFDRCYIHGDPQRGSRRGIALNSADTAVIDSYLSEFKEVGADSQAIAAWNGPGPFKLVNNYLEAAGENVLIGGADPAIRQLVPSDIEVRGNHLNKRLAWHAGDPTYEGTAWTIRNLFELTNARRVLVEGNLLEQTWAQSQAGFAVSFAVRNQDGGAPWSVVEDVTFRNNLVRRVGAGIKIVGRDDVARSGRAARILVANNLFEEVGQPPWGGTGALLQIVEGTSDVVFDHNTALHTGKGILVEGAPHLRFAFRNNIVSRNLSGFAATSDGGASSYFPAAHVRRNVIVGGSPGQHPADNFFPETLEIVRFAGPRHGDYRLAADSPYKGTATDALDPGVDFDELLRAGPLAARPAEPPISEPERPHEPRAPLDAAPPPGPEQALLFACALALSYTYLGYPLLGWIRAAARPRPVSCRPIEPSLSIVLVAHNEGGRIAARLENLLSLDYPPDRLEVLVGSDGSDDETVARAAACSDGRVQLFSFVARRGKSAVLNELVPRARGEIVVLADARQTFDKRALRALVQPFADASVGAVSGELMLLPAEHSTPAGHGVGFYWRYEKFIRKFESRADSSVGATGAIYAIRRRLFAPIPDDTVLDDVLIPFEIVRRGYRVVFEPAALAFDKLHSAAGEEFRRKVRTIAGTFQLFASHPWLLNPLANRLWFATVSHKALRLLTPLLLACAFVSNLLLLDSGLFAFLLCAQLGFYAAALLGHTFGARSRRLPLVSIPYVVCLLSWATLVALCRFVRGRQTVTWERVPAR
jgi:cellulose synthase/poly-beta-1,6-N-acetylglucosamine synthase-like glycosyltransferase